jgi:hypothetical protein
MSRAYSSLTGWIGAIAWVPRFKRSTSVVTADDSVMTFETSPVGASARRREIAPPWIPFFTSSVYLQPGVVCGEQTRHTDQPMRGTQIALAVDGFRGPTCAFNLR